MINMYGKFHRKEGRWGFLSQPLPATKHETLRCTDEQTAAYFCTLGNKFWFLDAVFLTLQQEREFSTPCSEWEAVICVEVREWFKKRELRGKDVAFGACKPNAFEIMSDTKQFLNFAILNNSLLSTDQTVLLTPVHLLATCFCKPSTSCERQEMLLCPSLLIGLSSAENLELHSGRRSWSPCRHAVVFFFFYSPCRRCVLPSAFINLDKSC